MRDYFGRLGHDCGAMETEPQAKALVLYLAVLKATRALIHAAHLVAAGNDKEAKRTIRHAFREYPAMKEAALSLVSGLRSLGARDFKAAIDVFADTVSALSEGKLDEAQQIVAVACQQADIRAQAAAFAEKLDEELGRSAVWDPVLAALRSPPQLQMPDLTGEIGWREGLRNAVLAIGNSAAFLAEMAYVFHDASVAARRRLLEAEEKAAAATSPSPDDTAVIERPATH